MKLPYELTRKERIRLSLKRYWYEKGFDLMSRLYVLTNLVTITASFIYAGTPRCPTESRDIVSYLQETYLH